MQQHSESSPGMNVNFSMLLSGKANTCLNQAYWIMENRGYVYSCYTCTQKSIIKAHINLSNHLLNKQEWYGGGLR